MGGGVGAGGGAGLGGGALVMEPPMTPGRGYTLRGVGVARPWEHAAGVVGPAWCGTNMKVTQPGVSQQYCRHDCHDVRPSWAGSGRRPRTKRLSREKGNVALVQVGRSDGDGGVASAAMKENIVANMAGLLQDRVGSGLVQDSNWWVGGCCGACVVCGTNEVMVSKPSP